MGAVKSCFIRSVDDKLMVTKMDLSHCGCIEVPHVVFNAERCIETLILASNQISSLPPQLFHCQEMKHLNLNDNCLTSIPPAIGSFLHLVSLKVDKNNLQDLPENLKSCKKLKRLSLNSNPWKQMPNIATQLINLEELYINDCDLNYLPASVGRLSKLRILELRNNNLCNLPLSMTRLELLTRIDISDNEFVEFPTCIPKLKSLTELLMDNNDIEEIIDIKSLVQLEHLDASYNRISNVSETIGFCNHLNMLNLSFNYIEQLPNSIGSIAHLQTLQLEMNELTELPKSIGKLSHLEELNLCNNKLYSLPNTIGLLRNLRNLNVSRNLIEEFPPEIGSCTKLAIINAAYNRLQVLPSEIGYLNNLKVLDVVGNFLMYLPITIINLRGVRAIWLSANQNVPLIPFTEDLNIASGERFLTNIALPQLGEIPSRKNQPDDKKVVSTEKTSSWNKKIRFAEDEDILPGKLHRTPTPFPKELRAPNRKYQRVEELKPNDNYVNIIDGKLSEQETPLLQPPTVPVTKTGSGLLNYSEGCVTRIREANIRRSNKDVDSEEPENTINENNTVHIESGYDNVSEMGNNESVLIEANEVHLESQGREISIHPPVTNLENDKEFDHVEILGNAPSANSIRQVTENSGKEVPNDCENHGLSYRQPVIYSNLVNTLNNSDLVDGRKVLDDNYKMDPQKIREMYHNDVIYESSRLSCKNSRTPLRSDRFNTNTKYSCSNSTVYRNNFMGSPSINGKQEEYKRTYPAPPPPPPPYTSHGNNPPPQLPPPNYGNVVSESNRPASKGELISLAEQMRNRNISPPCYEIAKMYSTKAALFESNQVDQLKSN